MDEWRWTEGEHATVRNKLSLLAEDLLKEPRNATLNNVSPTKDIV